MCSSVANSVEADAASLSVSVSTSSLCFLFVAWRLLSSPVNHGSVYGRRSHSLHSLVTALDLGGCGHRCDCPPNAIPPEDAPLVAGPAADAACRVSLIKYRKSTNACVFLDNSLAKKAFG